MNTRAMAAAILLRVRDHGAYSNVVLPQATRSLAGQDRAFVYRLVTDALRRQRTADAIIEVATDRSVTELDPEVSAVLEVAVGELLGDEGEAAYATVNESVEAVRQLGSGRAAGFVNGVLRRLTRDGIPELPADKARTYSVPEWVLGRVTRDHGRAEARSLLDGLRQPAPGVGFRVRAGAMPPDGAIPIAGIAGAYRSERVPDLGPGVVIMDAASVAVAAAVGAKTGERILDMAAAPGGKTIAIWDEAAGGARVVAMDSHQRRLLSARKRLEGHNVQPGWVLGDGARAPFANDSFDAVLLDAPCTGLGTLRRRPEIAMRLKSRAVDELAATQRSMLAEAWRVTRSGGRIVYSVCTLFAAETKEVVADYEAVPPPGLPGSPWGKGWLLAPHLTETDGMFVSLIRKT